MKKNKYFTNLHFKNKHYLNYETCLWRRSDWQDRSFWKPSEAPGMVFIQIMQSSKTRAEEGCGPLPAPWGLKMPRAIRFSYRKRLPCVCCQPHPLDPEPLLAASPSADGLKGAIWPWRWGFLVCQQASEPIWRCVSLNRKIFPIRKVD